MCFRNVNRVSALDNRNPRNGPFQTGAVHSSTHTRNGPKTSERGQNGPFTHAYKLTLEKMFV